MKDPIFRWCGDSHSPLQAQKCLAVNIIVRVLIFAFFGLGALLMNVMATFIVFWSTQAVNAVCHLRAQGYRNFNTREDSTNVWWVAILSLGEGWHNNHHGLPKSARHGLKWWEFDFTWCSIWALEKLGLCTNVIRPQVPTVLKPAASSPMPRVIMAPEVLDLRNQTPVSEVVEPMPASVAQTTDSALLMPIKSPYGDSNINVACLKRKRNASDSRSDEVTL